MRTTRFALATVLATSVVGVLSSASGVAHAAATPSLSTCKTLVNSQELVKGKLTVATDSPVYTPWFVNNTPTNGQGYESAVAYAIAGELGIAKSNVKWTTEAFDSSYVPGPKKFDFDINEISYTANRAQAVTFSVSYYNVNQSIVSLKTNAIVKNHTPAQLKNYQYGDQIGTTGLAYINNYIKPTRPPRVYSTLNDAVLALKDKQIDAIIIDTPSGQYMATAQVLNAKQQSLATQVGQFPSVGEHYGLLFHKGNPLATCVNVAINALTTSGQLKALQTKWLGLYNSVPTLKP